MWYEVVKRISLQVVDTLWMEHLDAMDSLQGGIGLRAYGQKDPVVEYKNEGRKMFEKLVVTIWSTIGDRLTKVQIEQVPSAERLRMEERRLKEIHKESDLGVKDEIKEVQSQKIGRNAPCPCGSGKKYKFCHGKA